MAKREALFNPTQSAEDIAVLQRAQQGETEAFEQIVRRYETPVYRYLLRVVNNSYDAEDLAQTAFLKMYQNIHKLEWRKNVDSWVFTIARNTAYTFLSKRRRRRENFIIDDPENLYEPPSTVTESESEMIQRIYTIQLLNTCLRRDQRALLLSYYWLGLKYRDIASVREIPVNTVKTRIRRTKETLRECSECLSRSTRTG